MDIPHPVLKKEKLRGGVTQIENRITFIFQLCSLIPEDSFLVTLYILFFLTCLTHPIVLFLTFPLSYRLIFSFLFENDTKAPLAVSNWASITVGGEGFRTYWLQVPLTIPLVLLSWLQEFLWLHLSLTSIPPPTWNFCSLVIWFLSCCLLLNPVLWLCSFIN